MSLISNCPICHVVPRIMYACGEYFVGGSSTCPFCGRFDDMHSSYSQEVSSWNSHCLSSVMFFNGGDFYDIF